MKYLLGFLKILIYSFLLFCLVAVALNVFWRINNSSPQSPVYACGSFGDKVMKIEKKYLFLGIMHYQGINYWSPDFLKQHKTKGCADQVQGLGIEVRWPTMEPWRSIWSEKEKIILSINQRTVLLEGQDRQYWDHKKLLIGIANEFDDKIVEYSQIKKMATFDEGLGLYGLKLNEVHKYANDITPIRIYWKEYQHDSEKVSTIVRCRDYIRNDDFLNCKLFFHFPHAGKNTSYIDIRFHGDLLPTWEEVLEKSLVLLNSSFQE